MRSLQEDWVLDMKKTEHINKENRVHCLEHGDEVSYSLLLVLSNALRDPGDISDFLYPC